MRFEILTKNNYAMNSPGLSESIFTYIYIGDTK